MKNIDLLMKILIIFIYFLTLFLFLGVIFQNLFFLKICFIISIILALLILIFSPFFLFKEF